MRINPAYLVLLASSALCTAASGCSSPAGDAEATAGSNVTSNNATPASSAHIGTIKQADSLDAIGVITAGAGQLANLYGSFQAAQAFLQAIGVLDDPNQDILNELQALEQQLNQVAGEITWFISQTDRETRLTDLRSAIFTTNDALNAGAWVDWYDLDLTTGQTTANGGNLTSFQRHNDDSKTNGTGGDSSAQGGWITWKNVISYSNADMQYDNGFVYDWRLGMPAFLQLIALRIQLIGMEDPNFTTDNRFHDELMSYHDTLVANLQTMASGLRCNTVKLYPQYPNDGSALYYPNYEFWVSCADIFSGLNETHVMLFADAYPAGYGDCISFIDGTQVTDQACMDRWSANYPSWYQSTIQSVQDNASRNVRNLTPWFDVQAMIDTLYLYANGATDPDLTHSDSTIRVNANPNLCLDVPYATTDWGTQVQIYTCNPNPGAQGWAYNRYTQNITGTVSGLCLDVQWSGTAPGTPVQIWGCNGSSAQKWTYDPQFGILTNKQGNVLDIPQNNEQPWQVLWTYPVNYSDAQRWR